MHKYYWEDFKVGDTATLGERVVDKSEVIAFAKAYDPQPFHIDEEAGRRSMFGGLIASGWHTVAMVMRMMVDSYLGDSASLGSPGHPPRSSATPARSLGWSPARASP